MPNVTDRIPVPHHHRPTSDTHRQMEELAALLGLPEKLELGQRKGKIDRVVALGVFLSFFAFPKRQRTDMVQLWWMDRRKICQCVHFSRWLVGGSVD